MHKKRNRIFMLTAATVLLGALSARAFFHSASLKVEPPLFSLKNTQGTAVEYKNTLYTLNFEQQKSLLAILNLGERANFFTAPIEPSVLKRIILYRFKEPNLNLEVLGYLRSSVEQPNTYLVVSSEDLKLPLFLLPLKEENKSFFSQIYNN